MTDNDLLEERIRASLTARAETVEATPALYTRVQRGIERGGRMRVVFAAAGVVAAVGVAAVVLPQLIDEPAPDIMDVPPDAAPTVDPSPQPEDRSATASVPDGVVWSDGDTLYLEQATVDVAGSVEAAVTSIAVEPHPPTDERFVAMVLHADGASRIGYLGLEPEGPSELQLRGTFMASPNGDGIVFLPGDDGGVAWIEGTDLHLAALRTDEGPVQRVVSLEGQVPPGLIAQQWVAQADAQVLLATDPLGGLWTLPMADSSVYDTGPVGAARLHPDGVGAFDGLLLPDLSLATLVYDQESDETVLRHGEDVLVLDGLVGEGGDIGTPRLTSSGSFIVTIDDPLSGTGVMLDIAADSIEVGAAWSAGSVAAAPLTDRLVRSDQGEADADGSVDPESLGLRGGSLVGTAGGLLVGHGPEGLDDGVALYPSAESEAVLGHLAVRAPGRGEQPAMLAVETTSEGETGLQLVQYYLSSAADPVGERLGLTGPVTGLVWSPDGLGLAVATDDELRIYAFVDGALRLDATGPGRRLPLVDWASGPEIAPGAAGTLVFGAYGQGSFGLAVQFDGMYAEDGTYAVGGDERALSDSELSLELEPAFAEYARTVVTVTPDPLQLRWRSLDRSGELPVPDEARDAAPGDIAVTEAGDSVIVHVGDRAWRVRFRNAGSEPQLLPLGAATRHWANLGI